jgi:alpha-tubulin suppressor-like RCC1 family protein
MSLRYQGAWLQNGAFDPLNAPTPIIDYQYELWSWGRSSDYGQLGLGNTTNYSSPKQVGSLTNWSKIFSGNQFTIGTKTDGTLWSWGRNNNFGQLGLGNNTNYSSPKQIGSLTNWSQSSKPRDHVLVVKTDGTLWSWGQNSNGQLGLGNRTAYSSPKQVGSLTNWYKAQNTWTASIAIKTDGTLWAWGLNSNGQLGLGNTTSYSSPKQVGSLTNWLNLAGGAYGTVLAIKTDGTLWAWGYGAYGQIGQNNTTAYSSPKQIGVLTDWSTVSCGTGYVIAVKTNGTLWGWGTNGSGELGLNNRTDYSSPKQIGALTNWLLSSCGEENTSAIKTDGTLWGWGKNQSGQLGLGNTTSYSSPKQVGSLTTWYEVSCGVEFTTSLKY